MKEEIKTETVPANKPTQDKESKKWMYITAVVLVALFAFVWIFIVENPDDIIDRDTTICIAENAIFYGADWCGYCKMQKALFGKNIDLLNYIECEENREACIAAEIKVYPTWIIDGETHTGVIYEEELRELTGC